MIEMLVQQTQYTIEKLINRIRSGRLALPDFQRDFVWSPSQVADLLESIAREWPIGSLLLLNGPQPFAFRAIDSAPVLVDPELDLYVLDGQQRVTAVYHAIQNVSQFVYYVDFANSSDDAEEVILWDRRARFERRFPTLESRAAAGIALVNDFWENQRFHEWLDHIEQAQRRNEFVSFRERRLGGLQSKVYKLLATELEQGIELEALAKIFETLNKTGVRLNAFDLLVAKLYPPPTSFNLRESWESAKRESALLSKFDPDGLELIKLIALLVRSREGKNASRGVRQGDVLALAPQYVAQYWEEAIRLYSAALAQMQEFGVNNSNLVPSWSMVLGLAGCLEFGFQARAREWWTSRLSNQTFGQAANTRIVAEFDNLSQGSFEATLPHDLSELLSLPARPNGLLLRGLAALVIEQRCPDPITGTDLSDSPKVEWFELSMTGQLLKLSQATDLSQTVFVSTTGLRHFDLRISLAETAHGREGLARQGFDLNTMRRTGDFLGAVFA